MEYPDKGYGVFCGKLSKLTTQPAIIFKVPPYLLISPKFYGVYTLGEPLPVDAECQEIIDAAVENMNPYKKGE